MITDQDRRGDQDTARQKHQQECDKELVCRSVPADVRESEGSRAQC